MAKGKEIQDNDDEFEKLKKKRRGGSGKPRLSQHTKMYLILFNLPHVKHMKTGEPGLSAAKILRNSSCNDRDKHLLDELLDCNRLHARESEPHERGDRYFYKTDGGFGFEKILEPMIEKNTSKNK